MARLTFLPHARREMQRDSITEDHVCQVIGDYDEMIEQNSGRTRYTRLLDDGREITVVVEHDGRTVVTAWWNKRRRR